MDFKTEIRLLNPLWYFSGSEATERNPNLSTNDNILKQTVYETSCGDYDYGFGVSLVRYGVANRFTSAKSSYTGFPQPKIIRSLYKKRKFHCRTGTVPQTRYLAWISRHKVARSR